MPTVWLNGAFVDEGRAFVTVRDAGLLHAAGVFTTMRTHGVRVFRMADHLRRLRDSCETLAVPLPHADAALTTAADELLRRNELAPPRPHPRLCAPTRTGVLPRQPVAG